MFLKGLWTFAAILWSALCISLICPSVTL